jgi:hypothetical protein
MDKDVFTIYSLNGGRAMELSVNIHKRKRILRRGVLESDLDFGDKDRRDFCVSRALFLRIMGATNGFDMENVYGAAENGEALRIPQKVVRAALRQELGGEQIKAMAEFENGEYEGDDYYDYGVLSRGFARYFNGEIDGDYFAKWCAVCAFCFKHMRGIEGSKLLGAYSELGELFKKISLFLPNRDTKEFEEWKKEIKARLRSANYKIESAKAEENSLFTTNGVVTYVSFGYYTDFEKEMRWVCVADYEKKLVNCFYAPAFSYDDEINYTFLDEADMIRKIQYYQEFSYDGTMREDYAKTKA